VDAHYAVFDAVRLRMTAAPAPRPVYVSYRIGSGVYWTRHRVPLAAGEALITDGVHQARARCGNRIADTPQLPVAAPEPAAADLDGLEFQAPPWTDWELPSALVVDLFPPTPLSRMAQSALAKPGYPSSSPSAWLAGVGTGMGMGAAGRAESLSGSTVPPVIGGINGPPGPDPFVPDPFVPDLGPLAPGWYLPLPGPIVIAPLLPNPGLPSTGPNEGGQHPIAPAWVLIPLPGTWSLGTPPTTLPGPPGVESGPPITGGTPGGTPGLPRLPIPVFPPPDTAVDGLPEPGTAMLLAAGMALIGMAAIRRRP
jgi:hypothetical protein